MAYIPLRKAVEFLGLHPNTLRKYADEGQIKSIKNGAGQRLYDVDSYQKDGSICSIICYCRVSSTKQKDDLARQVEFMRQRYPDSEIIQDIGSGLNFKRKGLQALLVRFMRPDQLTIVVACRDRLCRFGFELFEFMAKQNGGEIVVLSNPVHASESELTADLLAILHVFSCRMHGLRSYSQKIKEDPTIPKP
ncbi:MULTISPECIES: IS607 family transposase [unclassified Microcoleus]|uniref:IS607 family transposase n=1 Tax=unclassified Microcoleus TaxID=2642155 RepID=UPI001DB6621E|nr:MULTISPECIES: IS607 family transposase [unclassified Microcoleus]MCC3429630.1 IS607 family transposase [Microcoleus sp. PH2017_04_SCI_O_A]MCC3443360.1 IS607 family transposase [Microcoleus sp. PH2017_03_ELD_O_A]MCC3468388.1 IS607 family transposase [Microcoleus sp. PH2017_06_SFM_O_A]MCC3505518.1 IS607 family transposase [Microcoleus sp. PH2017_19_SFW_U_A]TAE08512.1 MAG: IS607 family transposase [Oscillatoriales cyanobacterium]